MAYQVIKTCQICKKEFSFIITAMQRKELSEGYMLLQDILPDLTSSERELFISGICGACFDMIVWDN